MDMSQALEIASRSDPGRIRSRNEDSIYVNAALGLAVLADGMGGYNAGEVASGMATNLIGASLENALIGKPPRTSDPNGTLETRSLLETAIGNANSSIYDLSLKESQYSGMGTTLVVTLFYDNCLTVAHVGDSRLYRLRDRELKVVTRDHSLLQEQIDSGMITPEEARFSQNRNLVTRALGVDTVVDPEIRDYDTLPGDIYLLCSDGLNDMLEDEEIAATLNAGSGNLEKAADNLIRLANENGGRDNVSVILLRVKTEFPARRSFLARIAGWLG